MISFRVLAHGDLDIAGSERLRRLRQPRVSGIGHDSEVASETSADWRRVGHRAGNLVSRTTTDLQMVESSEDNDGGRYRIRTYDFHRVKVALYR
jgi:hypothetical protein